MKLLLVSLIAVLALGLQAPAYAYQEEGPYVDLGLGMMSGKLKASYSLNDSTGSSLDIENANKSTNPFFFSLGGGYSYNLSNSINW
jgi:opacity protein-like surface antigen